jgi:hypothetical protein
MSLRDRLSLFAATHPLVTAVVLALVGLFVYQHRQGLALIAATAAGVALVVALAWRIVASRRSWRQPAIRSVSDPSELPGAQNPWAAREAAPSTPARASVGAIVQVGPVTIVVAAADPTAGPHPGISAGQAVPLSIEAGAAPEPVALPTRAREVSP